MTITPSSADGAPQGPESESFPRTRVLGVHGLRNYVPAPPARAQKRLVRLWSEALQEGLNEVAFPAPQSVDLAVAYYSPHLHGFEGTDQTEALPAASQLRSSSTEPVVATQEEVSEHGEHPEDSELWRSVFARFQGSPRTSSASEWLAQTADRISRHIEMNATPQEMLMLSASAELAMFVDSAEARASCRQEVIDLLLSHRPSVVVAHSLGSAVAYEALHAVDIEIDLFITIGSPLGARSTIQEILTPAFVSGRGARPDNVARWVNIADPSDVVPLVQDLASCYDGVAADLHPSIGTPGSHAVEKYLRCPTMGGVLAQYLTEVHTRYALSAAPKQSLSGG